MKMTKAEKDHFLRIECVIMTAKYLNIIDNNPIFFDQVDALSKEIMQNSLDVAKELKCFQAVYDEWFNAIVESENSEISVADVNIILKKDKAREALSRACIQYRKDNQLPEL